MKKGILGRKVGMTQVFTKAGKLIPVTVVEVGGNVVTQIKTKDKDGYDAIQLGFGDTKEKLTTKASVGQTAKANTTPKRYFREIRGAEVANYTLGQNIDADIFTVGEVVDVTGISKGKGTQGVIKRNNQTRGPMGHGSKYHRGVGSLGTRLPKHVIKGKILPGHMGSEKKTMQNLVIVATDAKENIILVSGNIPGAKKSMVMIRPAVKKSKKVLKVDELVDFSVKAEPTTTEENK